MLGESCLQGLQPPDRSTNPVGECRAVQFHAMPRKDLALSVQRKVVAVLGDQNVGQESGSGQAFGDRALRGRSLVDGPAGATAITRPTDTDDPQTRRHMVEHLRDGLADRMQRTAAARAGMVLDIEAPVLARQLCRQAWSINLRLGLGEASARLTGA